MIDSRHTTGRRYAESRTMPNRHQHASSGAHRTADWLMPLTGRMRHSPFAPLSRDPNLQGAGDRGRKDCAFQVPRISTHDS